MPKGKPLNWDDSILVELAERDDIDTVRALAIAYGKATAQVISPSNIANYLHRCDPAFAERVRRCLPGRYTTGAGRMKAPSQRAMGEGSTVNGDNAVVVTKPAAELGSIEDALRARGLDPDDWSVDKVIVNEWESNAGDGEVITLRQLKIFLTRVVPIEFVVPPRDVKARKPGKRRVTGKPRTIVLLPDQHAPYEDRDLHDRVVSFLADVPIDEVGLLGDVLDLPTVSRHRDNPAWAASVNECLQRGFELLRDYTEAAGPDVRFWKLKGNHDVRLETELLSRAERMFGIRPASVEGEQQDHALSLRRLLHLDALNIELVEPIRDGDNYDQAWHEITPHLEARHGWLSGSKSADKMLARVNRNLVVGHTHRQHLTRRTTWVGTHHTTIECLEAGTLRGIEGGGGFAVAPDWQQGFVVAQIVDDRPVLDFARYDAGRLRWRHMTW